MCKVQRLRAMSLVDAISAITAALTSGRSIYASLLAVELIKACGVEVEEGTLSIEWTDMPLAEAEELPTTCMNSSPK